MSARWKVSRMGFSSTVARRTSKVRLSWPDPALTVALCLGLSLLTPAPAMAKKSLKDATSLLELFQIMVEDDEDDAERPRSEEADAQPVSTTIPLQSANAAAADLGDRRKPIVASSGRGAVAVPSPVREPQPLRSASAPQAQQLARVDPQQIAQASDPERGETVLERARPELDPLGQRVGSFLVYPSFTAQGVVDDNIFRDDSDTKTDLIGRLRPGLRVRSDWSRHELIFNADADIGIYLDNTSENYEDARVGTAGRLDIDGNTFAGGGINFQKLHEDRGSPDDVGGRNPTEFFVLSGNAELFRQFGRFNGTFDVEAERIDFDDASGIAGGVVRTINNDDRDRTIVTVTGRAGYEIAPEYEAFLSGSGNWRIRDTTPDDAGFNRNSDGFSVDAGVSLDLGGLLFGDVFFGYKKQEFDDTQLSAVEGPDFGADLTWNVTPLTTIVGSASRTIRETTIRGASGFFATRGSLSVDHELLRNLLILLDGSFQNNDYEGITRSDDIFSARAEARYLINRHAYLSGSYRFRRRDSDAVGQDFTNNVGLVSVRVQY